MSNKRLQRTIPKIKDYIIYAFDIEYTRKDGILIEACIGNETEQWFYLTWQETIEALFTLSKKEKNTRFIVHAGDIAEFNHIIQYVMNNARNEIEINTTNSGDSIVGIELKRGKEKVVFYDMFAIFPMSLEKIAKIFAPDYPKLSGSVDFEKRDYDSKTDKEYLRRDVQTTCNAYKNISSMIIKYFGVQPAMTSAGTAMKAWLASLEENKKYYRLNETVENFCREGYFGAYVFPGRDNDLHYDVVSYDITAAYGARMRYDFPVGNGVYTTEYHPDYKGMWYCKIECIDAKLPIVPYRKDKVGVYWLGQPGDSCETIAITEEIEYYKKHGYKVEVLYGVYWLESEKIFASFIDKVEKVESIDSTTKQCAKLMRNSLYGRFGTKKVHERTVISHNPDENMIPYCNPHTGELVEYVYTIEEELDVAYIQPQWAAHITAYQRLAMYDLIFQCGVENCFGCDTDSVKTYAFIVEQKQLPLSETEYGKGKIEANFDIYRSHGPKNYCGKYKGKYYIKSKGIPHKALTEKIIEKQLYRTEETEILIEFLSLTKATTMMKNNGKIAFSIPRKRTLSSLHSEKWILENNCFIPVRNVV